MYTFIFDWKRTLYDPEAKVLVEGAQEILSSLLHKKNKLILIGKGDKKMHDEVNRLGLKKYFIDTIFHQEKKNMQDFLPFMQKNRKNTIIVGDRVRSELMIGNQLGATTVWFRQGKFMDEFPETKEQEPSFIITSLRELEALFYA